MPRENKKRGRRAEAQGRKLEADRDGEKSENAKRRRISGPVHENGDSFIPLEEGHPGPAQDQHIYFGALDEEEQEYFRNVDRTLEEDVFDSAEEKILLLDSVWLEAQGKELKLACSQSCSRLLERLVFLSKSARLKALFESFQNHFVDLVQHRFASHCCEALFTRTATLQNPSTFDTTQVEPQEPATEDLEDLFLGAISELEGRWTFLMTDRFASHTIRVLLAILAGESTELKGTSSSTSSWGKEQASSHDLDHTHPSSGARKVPQPYTQYLDKIISECTDGLDETSLRTLAVHPTGNPALQLLLRLELSHFGKRHVQQSTSLLGKLFSQGEGADSGQTESLMGHLVYDPIGSRLVETIIQYAPSKIFKTLYKMFFRTRIGSLARNDIAGYVVCKILERVSPEELVHCLNLILPHINGLAERGRTTVIKTLVERCTVRAVGIEELATALKAAYRSRRRPDDFSIAELLRIPPEFESNTEQPLADGTPTLQIIPPSQESENNQTQAQVHAALLTQSMFAAAAPIADLALSSLADLPQTAYLYMARKTHLSRVLQAALKSPGATLIFRRKLITRFYAKFAMLSMNPAGSHLIDAIWDGTHGMAFLRERVAEELAEAEPQMRESKIGRAVWRNWRMDLYKRKRGEWARQMKEEVGNQGFLSFPDESDAVSGGKDLEGPTAVGKGQITNATKGNAKSRTPQAYAQSVANGKHVKPARKTGLQLARERFAKANHLQPPAAKGLIK